VLDLKTFKPRTQAPPPITDETVEAAGGDPMCPMCDAAGGDGYLLPVVASVALIVVLVTVLRKKRAA
jgi:hypothetical protein